MILKAKLKNLEVHIEIVKRFYPEIQYDLIDEAFEIINTKYNELT